MERYNQIIRNQTFISHLERMELLEQNREYCRHGITHLQDVCRVAYIFALEDQNVEEVGGKEVIYAAGLLHDLGRVKQYENGTPHEIASVELAKEILPACGYAPDEIRLVCDAIEGHRGSKESEATEGRDTLSEYLYKADKAVRNCFCCAAADTCNWDETRKNKGIV